MNNLASPRYWRHYKKNLNNRAPARPTDDNLIWFWIGTHDEYERLLRAI